MPSWLEEIKKIVEEFLRTNQPSITALAAIFAISIALSSFSKRVRSAFRRVWHWLMRRRPSLPRETLRFQPKLRGLRWHMGSANGEPAMQVVGDFYATNIVDLPARILSARIVSPRRARTEGFVDLQSSNEILPTITVHMRAHFWVQPPVRREGQDFTATLLFTDQFNNDHRVKNVIFKGPKPQESKRDRPVLESIHAISDPIERDIVAVLKAEINRYRDCGRQVGGLGSVQVMYKGQPVRGIGTEGRQTDSPQNQSIILDPEQSLIESDNAAALLNLYQRLRDDAGGSDEKRSQFVAALLKRLSRNTEYAPVSYLILLVLFRIGRLPDALHTAQSNLQKDSAYGFSDLLRLLDGLLRFEHPSFTLELLDETERFVEDIEEYAFRIQERIAAIRALRLTNS